MSQRVGGRGLSPQAFVELFSWEKPRVAQRAEVSGLLFFLSRWLKAAPREDELP